MLFATESYRLDQHRTTQAAESTHVSFQTEDAADPYS
ncbi:Uncharacterised protein [Arcanobacterium haemolyticum]|uniref:Uncharacterized protein n=1 Tax=Arcanobacterium haemolyticum (strain ATCC 9345 / DSM 20595 / CCM 5947 / CCUG 17215 / LMG 16163 / NBRC 15585 / NCTC 8452 / 11018) TaxID=644284 RepID=D7BN06_ARCHD|nr:hypothetical protein Arch_0566 [Arcanobacterium haemolyticum DSM 20595]SPT75079.1 Uncharacterised protein [Arcanobacterium haemolyticum]